MKHRLLFQFCFMTVFTHHPISFIQYELISVSLTENLQHRTEPHSRIQNVCKVLWVKHVILDSSLRQAVLEPHQSCWLDCCHGVCCKGDASRNNILALPQCQLYQKHHLHSGNDIMLLSLRHPNQQHCQRQQELSEIIITTTTKVLSGC